MKEGAFELGRAWKAREDFTRWKGPPRVSSNQPQAGKGRESTMRESQVFQPGAGLGRN